jgi:ketose-bisphosphate aldolase
MPLVTLKEMLDKAYKGRYGVGQFDVFNLPMIKGVLDAAEKTQSPVILAYAKVWHDNFDTKYFANMVRDMVKDLTVPVVLHWDHAENMNEIDIALKNGFTGVMLDASSLPYEENVKLTIEVVAKAKKVNSSVESELGHVGFEMIYSLENYRYTDPNVAADFVKSTGIDALAVAIGNAHGVYTSKPKIEFSILEEIRDKTGVPLVLHGSSGIPDEDIKRCAQIGVTKFNIFTDLCLAAAAVTRRALEEGVHYMDTFELQKKAVEQVAMEKMELFGSVNKK